MADSVSSSEAVVVKPSARGHKALKESMAISQQLLRIRAGGALSVQIETVMKCSQRNLAGLGLQPRNP